MKELKKILSQEGIAFDAVDQHYKCFAHIFNLCVQDILKLLCSNADLFESSSEENNVDENDGEDDDEDSEGETFQEENTEAFSRVVYNVRETFKKIRCS